MSVAAYMLSLLGRQRQLLGPRFHERYPSNWLVWEPGPWRPARSESTSNTEQTLLPTAASLARPVGDDALCFELKRLPGALTVGRDTGNEIVVNDLTVSRTQLQLEYGAGAWGLRTTHLVLVDGRPCDPSGTVLKNAAVLSIGHVRMTFYEPEGFLLRLQAPPAKVASPQLSNPSLPPRR